MAIDWVRSAVREAVGFDPYPGTLNLRLSDADTLHQWREIRKNEALTLHAPSPEHCGGRVVPVVVTPDIPAAVIVPDVTRYGDDVLEIVAAVHLRSHLGLRDDDVLTLHFTGGSPPSSRSLTG
jgi:riboflavin kinase